MGRACQNNDECNYVTWNTFPTDGDCTGFSECIKKEDGTSTKQFTTIEMSCTAQNDYRYIWTDSSSRCHGDNRLSTWNNYGSQANDVDCVNACENDETCNYVTINIETGNCTGYSECDKKTEGE